MRPLEKLPCEVFMKMAQAEVKKLRSEAEILRKEIEDKILIIESRQENIDQLNKLLIKLNGQIQGYKKGVRSSEQYISLLNKANAISERHESLKKRFDQLIFRINNGGK